LRGTGKIKKIGILQDQYAIQRLSHLLLQPAVTILQFVLRCDPHGPPSFPEVLSKKTRPEFWQDLKKNQAAGDREGATEP
jgi:hypothetical protein